MQEPRALLAVLVITLDVVSVLLLDAREVLLESLQRVLAYGVVNLFVVTKDLEEIVPREAVEFLFHAWGGELQRYL